MANEYIPLVMLLIAGGLLMALQIWAGKKTQKLHREAEEAKRKASTAAPESR